MTSAGEHRFSIAGVEVRLEADDTQLPAEFAALFGEPTSGPVGLLAVTVAAGEGAEGRFEIRGDDLADAAPLLLKMASSDFPVMTGPQDARGPSVALAGARLPLFVFGPGRGYFNKLPQWRRMLAHFIFLRALCQRSDALFFHAASVVIDGRGLLLLGPKGSGKTTLALALGTRGHAVLGDETAGYAPATRMLLPMRRPARIKPGPRARALEAALLSEALPFSEDGLLIAPLDRLFPETAQSGAPLFAIAFLRGFAALPSVQEHQVGRHSVGALQALAPTMLVEPARRVFSMAALVAAARCFDVRAGEVDATAAAIEAALRR